MLKQQLKTQMDWSMTFSSPVHTVPGSPAPNKAIRSLSLMQSGIFLLYPIF